MRAVPVVLVLLLVALSPVESADAWSSPVAGIAKKKSKKGKKCKKKKKAAPPAQVAPPTGPSGPTTPQVARVVIAPAGVLLTSQGDTAQLSATQVDGNGDPIGGLPAPTWSYDDPAAVTVSGAGLASAATGSRTA